MEKTALIKSIVAFSLTLVVAILVIIAGGASVFGWFTLSNNSGTSQMGSEVKEDKMDINYYAYIYNGKTQHTDVYSFLNSSNTPINLTRTETIDGEQLTTLLIPQYDTVFIQRNKYSSFILRLEIGNPEEDGEIVENLADSGKIFISFTRDLSLPTTQTVNGQQKKIHYTSDVLRFSPFFDHDADLLLNDPDALYTYLNEGKVFDYEVQAPAVKYNGYYANVQTEALIERASIDSFTFFNTEVVDEEEVTTKVDRFLITINYDENDWVEIIEDGEVVDKKLNIYFFINYDPELIKDLGFVGLTGHSIGETDVALDNDLEEILIYHSNN